MSIPAEVGAFHVPSPPVKRRISHILDAPNPDGFWSAIQFTTTYFNINVNDYGSKDSDLAAILVARHASTET